MPPDITAGEAFDLIRERFAENEAAATAHRRAERKRRRDSASPNGRPDEREQARRSWRFGAGQTADQELAEIARARRLGLEREYVAAQDAGRRSRR